MAEETVVATPSDGGAGGDTQTQVPESSSQGDIQQQTPDGGSVDSSSTNASSTSKPGRSNVNWAQQRMIEKAISKSLDTALQEKLAPILEKLQSVSQSQVVQNPVQDIPDWNNLNGWLQTKVQTLLEERLRSQLPPVLNQFQGKLQQDYQTTVKVQEARNYLISQKDIGRDENKLAEIRELLDNSLLKYALEAEPLETTRKVVEEWRASKINPNAPPKSHLSTVTGGAGTQSKKEPSLAQILDLQRRVVNNPTIEEREKLEQEINTLFK